MANYDATSVQWLKGAKGVQANTSYYFGEIGSNAIRQAVIEVAGNSMDESGSGHGDIIVLQVEKDETVTIWDFGRGIPVGKHPEYPDKDVLTLLFTELHTGGKKGNQDGYSSGTVGTHGVGLTVVNAVSEFLQVWTNNKSSTYTQTFENGEPVTKVVKDPEGAPPAPFVKNRVPGTVIQFKVNHTYFDRGSKLDYASLMDWIKEASWFSYCNTFRGAKLVERKHVTFVCIGPDGKAVKVKRDGLAAYFDHMLGQLKAQAVIFDEPFVCNTPNCDIVLGWSSVEDEHIKCYTNAVLNHLGGTHQKAFVKCIDTVFRKYARVAQKFKPADLLVGAIGCVNVRVKAPKFDSQGKSRLASPEVAGFVEEQVQPLLEKWARQNSEQVKQLIERAVIMHNLTSALQSDKRLAAAARVKVKGKLLMPTDMLVSLTKNPAERELFLVEGESALGGCDEASERHFQEVLALRGKLTNFMRPEKKAKKGELPKINPVVVDILKATGIDSVTGSENMRVGKIYLLMDADSDGAHIASLLIALFMKIAPELFDQGKIYFVDNPLYTHQSKSGVKTYADNYQGLVTKLGDKIQAPGSTITRAKGLGELNSDVLAEVAFDKRTRKVIQLTTEAATARVQKIMGEDREYTKNMLGVA